MKGKQIVQIEFRPSSELDQTLKDSEVSLVKWLFRIQIGLGGPDLNIIWMHSIPMDLFIYPTLIKPDNNLAHLTFHSISNFSKSNSAWILKA
jgi:hypothetical protein